MKLKLNLYQIASISLVIIGFMVELIASLIYTWAVLNVSSLKNLANLLNITHGISLVGSVLIYIGLFFIFWDIDKKMKLPNKYTAIVTSFLIIVIINPFIWIIPYTLDLLGVKLSSLGIAVLILLPYLFAAILVLLIGIALFMISKNYPLIDPFLKFK